MDLLACPGKCKDSLGSKGEGLIVAAFYGAETVEVALDFGFNGLGGWNGMGVDGVANFL